MYEFNNVAKAVLTAYNEGNKKRLKKEDLKKQGADAPEIEAYFIKMTDLYKACARYARLLNAPLEAAETVKDRDDMLNKRGEEVWKSWKSLLVNIAIVDDEASKDRLLRCTEKDLANLIGFVQKFTLNKVNLDCLETFTAQKVYAIETEGLFARKVETDIGIRLVQATVLTDEAYIRLQNEKAVLNKYNNAVRELAEKRDELDAFKKLLKLANADNFEGTPLYKNLSAKVKNCEVAVKALENKRDEAEKALNDAKHGIYKEEENK